MFSCSTEDSSNDDEPSLDTHLISTVYLHESTERQIDYTYNSNNQLIESVENRFEQTYRQTFAYHSNGLIKEHVRYTNQDINYSTFLEYNSDGNVNKLWLGLNPTTELHVNYINNNVVEVLKTDVTNHEVINKFIMEMNSNHDMSNFKSYNSDNELTYNIAFLYDERMNVSKTISYDINSGAETVLEYAWGNGLTYHYNEASIFYKRMPNGMSLSDFIDLADVGELQINLLGNGMNPKLTFDTFDVEYTFYSNGMAKTQRTIYHSNDNQFEPNSFTYDYITKN